MTTGEQNNGEFGTESASGGRSTLFKPRHPMEILLKSRSAAVIPKEGDIIEGAVLEKKGTRLFIDLGALGIGIVYGREYYAAQDIIKGLTVGDRISAKVVEVDNDEGYIELSLQEAGRERRWVDFKRIMQTGEVLELRVEKANTGGLILHAMGIEGFLPASQLSFKNYPRVDGGSKERIFQELQKLVGQTLKVKILDLNPEENKLIFSEKGLNQEAMHEAISHYVKGDVVEGEVTSVVDFGAFMKFGDEGLEGLIHLSEIDWMLIENPREVLKPGDKIKAKIIDIQGDKVSLSLKQLKVDPWTKAAEKYQKDQIIQGKVTKFNPYGAFVEVERDIQGLIHISEFGSAEVMRKEIQLGGKYAFSILLIDPKEHRMSLGLANSNPASDSGNNGKASPLKDEIPDEGGEKPANSQDMSDTGETPQREETEGERILLPF